VRDLVLGVRILDGRGDDIAFGGRVMKNVAGFDVSRLMVGALGTLGVLVEVSLKCLPLPKVEATLMFECGADDAIRRVNEWGGRPLPLSATCWHDGRLAVRLSGAAPAVESAIAKLGGEVERDAAAGHAYWASIREQTHAFFGPAATGAALWRLSVKSTAPLTEQGGTQLVEWGGALRWMVADTTANAAGIRQWAQSQGGHATLFRAADKSAGVFQPLPAALLDVHRRLKANFDPAGILNPGRLYPSF
jgi:glycolate oxidase FAD binding subunit